MTDADVPPDERPAAGEPPAVRTAPAEPAHWWSTVPRHLGRARTSTVVLVVLWLAIFTLYIYVRPETAVSSGSSTGTSNGGVQPAPAPTAPSRTTARPTATAPATTSPSRDSASRTSATSTRTTSPTDTATVPTTPPPTTIAPSLPGGGSAPTS